MKTQTITNFLVPTIVGIFALAILDNSLGNWSRNSFRKIFSNPHFRYFALFGAAYGGNGGKIFPATVAVVLYMLLEWDNIFIDHLGINPFEIDSNMQHDTDPSVVQRPEETQKYAQQPEDSPASYENGI